MKIIYNTELSYNDLDIYQFGTEVCKAGHAFGPGVKEFYKIHYIHKGKGIFKINGQTYHLREGQGFVIYPNILVYYKADYENPWEYSWIGFHGIKVELILKQSGFIFQTPVFNTPNIEFINNCLKEMLKAENIKGGRDAYLRGYLYLILSQHIEKNGHLPDIDKSVDTKEQYVRTALDFIERNYDKKITVQDIADNVGVDSKYLWRLFNLILGISPVKVLLNTKVEKACRLMDNPKLSIADISRSVGYEDALQFSKIFKKIKGDSPSYYRKTNKVNIKK
jgi:AraC-like DNA-binding protein